MGKEAAAWKFFSVREREEGVRVLLAPNTDLLLGQKERETGL